MDPGGGHEATETGLAYAPVSQAHGHNHIVQCFAPGGWGGGGGRWFFLFSLTPEVQRVLKSVLGKSGGLQHMIQWIPATRGTWQRPRVHMCIPQGYLMQ